MCLITCNDGKCGVSTEWCKKKMEEDRKKAKELIDEGFYESENDSSTNDWIFEPTNGFSRSW